MPTTRGGCAAVETSARSRGSTSSPATSSSTGTAVAASTRSSPSATNSPSLSRQRRSCSLRTSFSFSLSRDVITARPSRRASGGGGFGLSLERLLRLARELGERRRVGRGEIGEDLAVELDAVRLQAGDELVVREPVRARTRVDAHDPEPAEVPLLVLAVTVGVDERVLDLLLGVLVRALLDPPVALRLVENLAALLARVDGALDARHRSSSPE